ncbi:CBS domain-containing protein [Babesia divergens]|uniref:CBS domain-containing protein n=1 Tax=Babesia divergens TaxID=32595 RepID=A0AAD9LLH6_BABDI|nr:CBS domain-containing protein [Babesia divergens]
MQLWVKALLAIVCAAASSLFSGLILGFMSLDILQLQLLTYVEAKSPQDRLNSRRARRILPLRRDPNLLLSTLIFSNSMVNALMVLLLGDMLDMTWGFIVSTLTTAILGEIAPQSIFMKHSLKLCGFFATPLKLLVLLLYPMCKPLAMLLDFLVGPYSQVIYNRQQLKALVDLQLERGNVLTPEEAKMLKGCLELSSVCAESIMTPLDEVFYIEDGTTVTMDVVHTIAKSGFTNIPIIAKGDHRCVVGFLIVKDLLMLDTTKSYHVRDLFFSIGKPTYAVDAESCLNDLISYFKADSTHVVVVRKAFIEPHTTGDPVYKHDTIRDVHERGLEGSELVIKRKETQIEKYNRLNSIRNAHEFSLNSIKSIFPLQDALAVLRALGLPDYQENIDILKRRSVYLLTSNTLIPSGSTIVLLKGSVGYVDEMVELALELPFALKSQNLEKSVVTLTDCEVVEVETDEVFQQ